MDHSQFRSKSKIVAIVDLVLSAMSLWFVLALFLIGIGVTLGAMHTDYENGQTQLFAKGKIGDFDVTTTMSPYFEEENNPLEGRKMSPGLVYLLVGVVWFLVLLALLLVILQIVAAIKLLNSTQPGMHPIEAMRNALYWRNVTLVFTILAMFNVITGGRGGSPSLTLLTLALRLLGLWIVHNYIKELEISAINTLPTSGPGQVFFDVNGEFRGDGNTNNVYPNLSVPMPMADRLPPKYEDVVKQPAA